MVNKEGERKLSTASESETTGFPLSMNSNQVAAFKILIR